MTPKELTQLTPEQLHQVVAAASKTALVTGGGVSGGGILLSSQVIGLIGVVIALLGLIVNWYYRYKEYKLKEREHQKLFPDTDSGKLTKE